MYMDVADRMSQMSYAIRAKVGTVIEKDGAIISHGWNGQPAGMDNACEYREVAPRGQIGELVTKPTVMHAEANAIVKLARSGVCSDGATAYVTLEPCVNCAKLLHGAGIKRVVYRDAYRDHSGVELLKELNVQVEQL
jgi:dCMP deaminase